ncbi:MAG: Na+:solute symporter, partial [Kiritimatiellia bacterium]
TAMAVSFCVAVFFQLVYPHLGGPPVAQWQRLVIGIIVTTVAWVGVTLLTRPVDDQTLFRFCTLIRAGGPGWKKIEARAASLGTPIAQSHEAWPVPSGLLCMSLACCAVYAVMFAVGSGLYGYAVRSACLAGVAVIATITLFKVLSAKQSKEG